MIREPPTSISRAALVHALAVFLPPAAAATGLALLAYLMVQQSLRLAADDVPATLAASAIARLDQGVAPEQALSVGQVELTASPAPFELVFDASGRLLASSATLDGQPPAYPAGVLGVASTRGEDRVTWQPRPGVRLATVARPWQGGFVVAGQSLQLAEQHIDTIGELCVLGWLATEALIALAVALGMALEVALLR
ncbi:MAG: hypothetical protein JO023_03820 [Chloroflexi bacterium]|nr:hypothetical protein [Chloroflexota bacterium]